LLQLAEDYQRNRDRVALQQRIVQSTPTLLAYDFELDRHWESAIAEALGDRPRKKAAVRRRAQLLAGALMGAIRVTLRQWYESGGRADLRALGQEAFELIRNGAGPDDERGGS